MKFLVTNTSDMCGKEPREVELGTLDELLAFVEEHGGCVILTHKDDWFAHREFHELEIYDESRPVSQGGLAMVNMGNNTKVTNVLDHKRREVYLNNNVPRTGKVRGTSAQLT